MIYVPLCAKMMYLYHREMGDYDYFSEKNSNKYC
jgi:hypothetical protein